MSCVLFVTVHASSFLFLPKGVFKAFNNSNNDTYINNNINNNG